MSDLAENSGSYLDIAANRTGRIEMAVTHLAKLIELELIDVALNGPENLDADALATLQLLQGSLASLSDKSRSAADSIATTIGSEVIEAAPRRIVLDVEPIKQPTPAAQPVAPAAAKTPVVEEVPEAEPIITPVTPVPASTPSSIPTPATRPVESGASRLTTPRHEAPAATPARKERKRAQQVFEGPLYESIIPAATTPLMELRGKEPIDVIIHDDSTLIIGDNKIKLEGDNRFVFNALMRLRDTAMSSREIRDLGFRPGTSESSAASSFSQAMAWVSEALKECAGVEIVKKIGTTRSTKYAVNPAAVLVDRRIEDDYRAGDQPDLKKK